MPKNDNEVIIVTSVGDFFIYDGQSFTPILVSLMLKNKEINNVQVDKDGNFSISIS